MIGIKKQPNNPTARWNVVVLAGILLLLCGSCSESLPPYLDPREVLEGTLEGRYVLILSENSLKVDFTVRNAFDETLEGKASLQGDGQIVLQRNNDRKKTFVLSVSNMVAGNSFYNQATGVLKLDPGASITFRYTWNFIDDSNRDLRQADFQYVGDPSCQSRMIAYEETFILRAQMKVYEKVAEVVAGPVAFSMCHVTAWVNPMSCPPILTDQPCSLRR